MGTARRARLFIIMRASGWLIVGAGVLVGGYFVGKKAVLSAKAGTWLPTFKSAAASAGVPENILLAVAEIESGFNPTAYNASSGATGMMQLEPQFYPGVDPADPAQAIPAAAQSLADYHRRFGTWTLALAAYNWGPGNVDSWLNSGAGTSAWPTETQNYVAKAKALAPVAMLA